MTAVNVSGAVATRLAAIASVSVLPPVEPWHDGRAICIPLPPDVLTKGTRPRASNCGPDMDRCLYNFAPGDTLAGIEVEHDPIRLLEATAETAPSMEFDNPELRKRDIYWHLLQRGRSSFRCLNSSFSTTPLTVACPGEASAGRSNPQLLSGSGRDRPPRMCGNMKSPTSA